MSGGVKLELIVPLEASIWENIRPVGLLELTFYFILPFTEVHSFSKQNVWDVPEVIEQKTVVPQVRTRKSAELGFLGFLRDFLQFQHLV